MKNTCKICKTHVSDCKCMFPTGEAECPRHRGIMTNYGEICICAIGNETANEKDELNELYRMTKSELIEEIMKMRKDQVNIKE